MKLGMTIHKKCCVGDHWIWLCKQEHEWATYILTSPDESETEHGHYFSNRTNAIADFDARIKQYFPVPEPVQSVNGWSARFEARWSSQSGGTDIYLLSTLADGTTKYEIYNDQYDDIWEVRELLTSMDADTLNVELVLKGKPVSVRLYKASDWSWWAFSQQGIHKKLRVSWQTGVYEVIHRITEFGGDHLFR